MKSLALLSLHLFTLVMAKNTDSVLTSSGLLKGSVIKTDYGFIGKYLGVPYGSIPGRFLPPEEIHKENDMLPAEQHGPSCVQAPHAIDVMYSQLSQRELGKETSEECLYLNIYTPKIPHSPIMVWFPGEGYDFADANQFDGTELAARGNVTVITVNYRVGPFGFLTSMDGSAPTNNGIRDILLSLKWIQKNIKSFGGDPDNVTVFGRFTGAASLSILLASPHFKKSQRPLANKFIFQSGIATGPYIFEDNPKEALKMLANRVNCSDASNCEETVECLKHVPYDTLMRESLQVPQRWRPVIDNDILNDDPINVITNGDYRKDISVIIGHNKDEGSLCLLTHFYLQTPHHSRIMQDTLTKADFEKLFEDHIRDYLKGENDAIVKAAIHEYGYQMNNGSYRDQYLDFCGSMYIKAKSNYLAAQLSRHGTRVYTYQFTHRPLDSIHPPFLGAAHGDEVLFVFGLLQQPSGDDQDVTDTVISAWTNFAKTGNPNPIKAGTNVTWLPTHPHSPSHLRITTQEGIAMEYETKFDQRLNHFWNTVIPNLQSKCQFKSLSDGHLLILGNQLEHPAAEYLIIGLALLSLILLLFSLFAAVMICKRSNQGSLHFDHKQ